MRAGGKLAVGRESLSLEAWRALKAEVFARQGGRCLVCPRRIAEYHHVRKRAAGGADTPDNVVGLSRDCHRRADWPYAKGRLCIVALGAGVFTSGILYKKPGI